MSQTPPAAPPHAQAVEAMRKWSCQSFSLDEAGQPDGELSQPLTVGEKFLLRCEGSPVTLNKESLRLELPKEQHFALRILETRRLEETQGDFVAVTWIPATVELKSVALTDGVSRVSLDNIKIQAQSVIDPEKNPERKPFGPWGAQALPLPAYVWLALASVIALSVLIIALAIRKRIKRKRLLRELKTHATALSPFNQFNKDLRKLARQSLPSRTVNGAFVSWNEDESRVFFKELDSSFRWYLARELVIDAINGRPRAIVNEVKRVNSVLHTAIRKDLLIALNELDGAIKSAKPASADDTNQLMDLCRTLAAHIHKARSV